MSWRAKEPFNSYSHFLGVVLSIAALVTLVVQSGRDSWSAVAFAIYGLSLVLLYTASTLYHWLPLSPRADDLMRRFDHIAIFGLIAGSYTPVCLVSLRGGWGWTIFSIVWGIAIAGVVLKLAFEHLPNAVSAGLYVAMGWVAVVAVAPLTRAFSTEALMWLLGGGIAYTVGAIIYAAERPDPYPQVFGHHEIFHVFVLAGSALHFVFMARFVVPAV